jgi:hypothetical protein
MSESPYEYEDISAGIEPELWDSACQHVLCMAPRLLIAYARNLGFFPDASTREVVSRLARHLVETGYDPDSVEMENIPRTRVTLN